MSFADEYGQRLTPWSDVQYAMPRMYETALRYPGVAVLELGVREGYSTSAFLAAAEATGGHVWSVDVNEPQVPEHWLASGLWTFILGDDMAVDLPAAEFDVVFIDTSHLYEHTLAELRKFVPLVKPGGTVFLHDTIYMAEDNFPVARALDAFCKETGLTWTEHGGQFGFGEIERPNG